MIMVILCKQSTCSLVHQSISVQTMSFLLIYYKKMCQLSSAIRPIKHGGEYNKKTLCFKPYYSNLVALLHKKVNNNKLSYTIFINITIHLLCSITLSQTTYTS